MSLGGVMASEVARLRPQIVPIVGCAVCALGIATDLVGDRYGYAKFENWRCASPSCPVSTGGLSDANAAAIVAIAAKLPTPRESVEPSDASAGDSRLPADRDECGAGAPF